MASPMLPFLSGKRPSADSTMHLVLQDSTMHFECASEDFRRAQEVLPRQGIRAVTLQSAYIYISIKAINSHAGRPLKGSPDWQ